MSDAIFGPAGDRDAETAHLFLCRENGCYAVSLDQSGSNLPNARCLSGWKYVQEFALGVREALPIAGDPEPVLRALRDTGYYIVSQPSVTHGTGQ